MFILWSTPNRFTYDVVSPPLWDGSGTIKYTTTGNFAVGEINSFKTTNLGLNYKKTPVISGVDPSSSFKASANVLFDEVTNTVTGVEILEDGLNYSQPKAIVVDGDGVDLTFSIITKDTRIFSIQIDNPGYAHLVCNDVLSCYPRQRRWSVDQPIL